MVAKLIFDMSNISFATILTNIFAKKKSFFFSYFVSLDKKLENGITGENLHGQKWSKHTINSWRDYLR